MTLKELVEFEKEWLDEAGYTKENVIIALCSIKAHEQQPCNNWCPKYQRAWRLGYERGIYNATMEDGFAPVGWYVLTNDEVKEVNKKIMEKIKHKRTKQGKWYSNGLGTAVHCSICENSSPYRFNYCPNCGADMENEED